MKRGPISKLPPSGGTLVNTDAKAMEVLASKEGFLLLRKGHLEPRCLRSPESVCLCCRCGGGSPLSTRISKWRPPESDSRVDGEVYRALTAPVLSL